MIRRNIDGRAGSEPMQGTSTSSTTTVEEQSGGATHKHTSPTRTVEATDPERVHTQNIRGISTLNCFSVITTQSSLVGGLGVVRGPYAQTNPRGERRHRIVAQDGFSPKSGTGRLFTFPGHVSGGHPVLDVPGDDVLQHQDRHRRRQEREERVRLGVLF